MTVERLEWAALITLLVSLDACWSVDFSRRIMYPLIQAGWLIPREISSSRTRTSMKDKVYTSDTG